MEIDESSGESIKVVVDSSGAEEIKDAVFNHSGEDEATASGDAEMDDVCTEAIMTRHPHISSKDIKGEGRAAQAGISAKFSGL